MMRILKSGSIDGESLKKERLFFYQYFVLGWVLVLVAATVYRKYVSADHLSLFDVLRHASRALGWVSLFMAAINLDKLTKILYERPLGFFIVYCIFLALGLWQWYLWALPLFFVWLHSESMRKKALAG